MIERLVFTMSSLPLRGLGRIEVRRDSAVHDLKKREHLFKSEQVLSFSYVFICIIPKEFLQIIVPFVYTSSFYYCEHNCSFGLTDAATNGIVLIPFIYDTMNE